jgi:alpha,alpha-trehalase
MKKIAALFSILFLSITLFSQDPPDKIYGELFKAIQEAKIFPDGKTFVDCIPKRDPALILADYRRIISTPGIRFALELFVKENFIIPQQPDLTAFKTGKEEDIKTHIESLWKKLIRKADTNVAGSSLLPLPDSYIVPGGRFREVYYWDSYFTMLGLQQSGEIKTMENMLKNFAYLIETYGHIPNGNRTYYLGRSQPPFFSLMVALLAESKGAAVYKTYLPVMRKEYDYWMSGADELKNNSASRRVVKMENGALLNRYWDDVTAPRQESYNEDVLTTSNSGRDTAEMYHHLRAGAESGWDFSSRWFADGKNLKTIQTTDLIPVDLNCLMFALESNIARAANLSGDRKLASLFNAKAAARKTAILKFTWNSKAGFFTDYNFKKQQQDTMITAAGLFPLFTKIASQQQATAVASKTKARLLKAGGIVTTNNVTGQQWDAPNGWAPLQWVSIKGLENYRQSQLAETIATRWLSLNERVFKATGKMMEKYNVLDTKLEAGGGEYPGQDGFGWTNGVYLKVSALYKSKIEKKQPALEIRPAN